MEEAAASPFFVPSWDKEELIALRKQAIKRWQALTIPFSPFFIRIDGQRTKAVIHTKILPLWHGTSAPICDSIAQIGFTYFGKYSYSQGKSDSSSTDVATSAAASISPTAPATLPISTVLATCS